MDTLDGIFETLRDLGHCASQEDFSANWLGRSRSYFAHLRSSQQPCSLASIGMLAGRLREIIADGSDGEGDARRRLRAAWIAAKVMFQGEWELLHLRPRDRVAGLQLPQWINQREV